MGTKNKPAQFDCYANAAPDEPMFILLGRDRHAPMLVRLWALLRQRDGDDEEQIAEALTCAEDMLGYRRSLRKPPPDNMPEVALIERSLYVAATVGLAEHPEEWLLDCDCNLCRSYGDGDA